MNQTSISEELKIIQNADQSVRMYDQMLNIKYKIRDFYSVSDSLFNLKNNNVKYLNEIFDFDKIPSIKAQISKLSKKTQDDYYEEQNSGQKLMVYVDSINRKRIYEIIKKYGYPSFYNRKWKDESIKVGITSILTHTDYRTEFGKKLLKLMLKEYFDGRVEEGEMKQLLWHVDGRQNGPPYDYIIDNGRWEKVLRKL